VNWQTKGDKNTYEWNKAKVRSVPIGKVQADTSTNRPMSRKKIAAMMQQMKRGKSFIPPFAEKARGRFGEYEIVDGHHRYQAAKNLGASKIIIRTRESLEPFKQQDGERIQKPRVDNFPTDKPAHKQRRP
jgi:hypothetical protein